MTIAGLGNGDDRKSMHTLSDLRAGKLSGTTHLRINEPLSEFPRDILDLADTLEILDLNHTGLNQLPADFGRLKKLRILFASFNQFTTLPEVLADCPSLTMIGFRDNQIHTVPQDSLPPQTNWLILTDNKISELPASMGKLSRLQKCMLAGNQLSDLPSSMVNCTHLELLRLSANRFEHLPDFLFDLPQLSWLTFAGNPLHTPFPRDTSLPEITTGDLEFLETIGEGASGVISRARWAGPMPDGISSDEEYVAYKAFKGAVTSDGFAADELSATLAAGQHKGLVRPLAIDRSGETLGLVMSLIPEGFQNLGLPPSFDTCTRDVFPDDVQMECDDVRKVLLTIAEVMAHLRSRGVCHNDLYAHNILVNEKADTLLTDFGAAANYASLPEHQASRLEQIEMRAFGYLIDDLLNLITPEKGQSDIVSRLSSLQTACLQLDVGKRPDFTKVAAALRAIS